MLDWLKRKGSPPATEPTLESEGQKPLTDERLERLLGRLGPDSTTRSERVAPPRTEPVAEAQNTVEPPPSAPVAEVLQAPEPAPRPDGKMVVFDTEGNVTDMTPPRPSTARSVVSEPAEPEPVQAAEPPPSDDA